MTHDTLKIIRCHTKQHTTRRLIKIFHMETWSSRYSVETVEAWTGKLCNAFKTCVACCWLFVVKTKVKSGD